MSSTQVLRSSALTTIGCLIGLLILALAPTLLRQTSFNYDRFNLSRVRLVALQEEELLEREETEPEPEKPPEPEILPDPPELEPPKIDMADIEPPQTTYDAAGYSYSGSVTLPSLTTAGMKGVQISAQNLARKTAAAPVPGLPKHGPPRTRFNPE